MTSSTGTSVEGGSVLAWLEWSSDRPKYFYAKLAASTPYISEGNYLY